MSAAADFRALCRLAESLARASELDEHISIVSEIKRLVNRSPWITLAARGQPYVGRAVVVEPFDADLAVIALEGEGTDWTACLADPLAFLESVENTAEDLASDYADEQELYREENDDGCGPPSATGNHLTGRRNP